MAVETEEICECDGHTVHKLIQRRLTADWLAPREGDCSRMHSKISSACPCSTQRQARELISDPNLATGARLLSFNRTQSRVVTDLLTGLNTLRRHLHIRGLCDSPICRKCGTGAESSVHILCECEVFFSLRHTYLGSFFLDPEDIRVLGVGAIWNFAKGTGPL
jgi:hypothetical protein